MRIALPFENNNIFGHFEYASSFKIYEIENNKIVTMRFVPVSDINDLSIDVMLCGSIGDNSKNTLLERNVDVHTGYNGNADIAVHTFLGR